MPAICFLIALLSACTAWAQISADFPANVIAGSDESLYVLSGTNLLRTQDGGTNWRAVYPVAAPGQVQQILSIATNPVSPNIVYAATELARGGVFKSIDNGTTWAKVDTGLPSTGSVERLVTVENQPDTLYAKIGTALYKTANGGNSWSLQSTFPAQGTVFTINTRTPDLMYFVRQSLADSTICTIYRSTNEGASWTIVGTVDVRPVGTIGLANSATSIISSPIDPQVAYLTTRGPYVGNPYNAVHRSFNQGINWAVVRPTGSIRDLLADLNGNIFGVSPESAAASSRFEKSTDGGQVWTAKIVAEGVNGPPALSLDLRHPNHIFAGLSRPYRSTNSGETWNSLAGMVQGTLAAPANPVDFRAPVGASLTQPLPVRFLEGTNWQTDFTATVEGAPWLSLSETSGTTPRTITVRVSTEGLALGSYSGTIRLSSPAATGDLVVPVSLTVGEFQAPRSYRISTIAGGGSQTPPLNSPALQARFSRVRGVAVNRNGQVLLADDILNQVFRINSGGIVDLVAGNGTSGTEGDGGPAVQAQLNSPEWISTGASNEILISDTGARVVRSVNAQGNIQSLGAANRSLLGGVSADAQGNLYIPSFGEIRLRTAQGLESRFSTGPNSPGQSSLDGLGNLYVTDPTRHQILRINAAGESSVIAGTGSAGYSSEGALATLSSLNGPQGIVADAQGNVFFTDTANRRVRMIDPSGLLHTIAGTGVSGNRGDDGPALLAELSSPYSLALDEAGNLYVADTNRIRKLELIRPAITPNGVANAASYAPTASPGSLVAIFGDHLAQGIAGATGAPWPNALAGASVTLNGRPMPLYYVSPGQINAMVPYETPLGPATLVVSLNGVTSTSYTLNISAASPGIITFGENRAVAVNEDGTVNTSTNPAKPGSTIVVYLIGLGPTSGNVATGAAAPLDRLIYPAAPATVQLGSQTVTPEFLGLTPGSVALAQMNLKISESLADGDYALKLTIAGQESNAPVITVRR